ncbi:hypothetical protein PGT21_033183 [Puccinia graminis f. sp. tritici]|uniref:Uncharacterized protein n=1 Tax=Puccinia graminis f. sp. tritici TaxID=56615 RepID=A0A5B0PVN0_PUCGR|nr:hypothetical protein PGTUg99_021246 [Puccinia graminis f. sp. tritici]KAA1104860.1 hypothetical protein PGT21_033183 [Puccinia graminis f. sp. tritici]
MNKRHQDLVRVNKDRNIQKSARRAALEVSNNEVTTEDVEMCDTPVCSHSRPAGSSWKFSFPHPSTNCLSGLEDIDATNQLEPVIGINDERDEVDDDGSRLDEAEAIPPGTFGEPDGESDDEEAELSWMEFVDVAVYQINSEPEDLTLDSSSPLYRRQEEEIDKLEPNNSAWYPFLNRESSPLGSLANNASEDTDPDQSHYS